MANQYKGETSILINGEEKNLVYDVNALAELEDKFGVDIDELLDVLDGSVSIKKIRTFLWAGLIHEYMDEDGEWKGEPLTEKKVGKWIGTEKTPLKPVIQSMGQALRVAMGVGEDEVPNVLPGKDPAKKPATPKTATKPKPKK